MKLVPRGPVAVLGIFCVTVVDMVVRFLLPADALICNPGMAWGLPVPPTILLFVNALLVLALLWVWRRASGGIENIGWSLMLAGGAANLFDRALLGCVRDYLHLPPFPSFNLADMMLTLGVGALVWAWLRLPGKSD